MVDIRFKLLACLCVAFCCNLSVRARVYVCKENNIYGSCMLYENCTALQDTPFTADMINRNHCSNSRLKGRVVCCPRRSLRLFNNGKTSTTTTTTSITTTTSTTTTTTEKPIFNKRWPQRNEFYRKANIENLQNFHLDGLALLNKHNCGSISDFRLANGINAMQGEFPWMALLLDARMKSFCGGSVITERFVLTAAHCIADDLQVVRLGEHRISTKRDCVLYACQSHVDFHLDPYQKPIIHPDYRSLNYQKDIALIKLDRDIDFKLYNNIAPICLPTKSTDYSIRPKDKLILAGWGLQKYDLFVDVLQKGVLKIKPLYVCQRLYPRMKIDNSKLCIQAGPNDTVSCHGDSGSPLFWKTDYQVGWFTKQHYTQIGLVSLGYGKECGDFTSDPFMYENVTDSMVWITHALYKAHFNFENNVSDFFNSHFGWN